MKDLFGNDIDERPEIALTGKAKRDETPKGYPAPPGTGPDGETCRTCANAIGTQGRSRRIFWKCLLLKHRWTNSYGTDIRLKSPACRQWVEHEKEQ